jgi:hypothetical protein
VTGGSVETPAAYKQFLYISGEPNHQDSSAFPFERKKHYPLEDPFRGTRFPKGATLELLRDDGQAFTVTSWQGEPFTFAKYFSVPGWGTKYDTIPHEVMTVPWDAKQARPLCVSDARNPLHWYFLRVANHLWLLWGVFLVAVLFAAVQRRAALALLLVLLALAIVVPDRAAAGNMLNDNQCRPRASLPPYRLGDGHIRPVPDYRMVAPYGDARGYKQVALAQSQALLGLCIAHTLLALLILPALKGAHYLLVPHPAERFVRTTGTGPERSSQVDKRFAKALKSSVPKEPPPEFVSENQTERARKLTEKLRAERELAEEAARHRRATAAQMSEKDSPKDKPTEPEVVSESGPKAPGSDPLRRVEQDPQATNLAGALSGLFGPPTKPTRQRLAAAAKEEEKKP